MNPVKIYLPAVLFFIVLSAPVFSQNMNSPYSIYGIGDIDHHAYNKTSGMGGAGLALTSPDLIINNNPASIAGFDRSFFVVNVNAAGRFSQYKGTPVDLTNDANRDFWIKAISLHVKVNKIWTTGVGMNQFSNVNYKLSGSRSVEGSLNTYNTYYEGNGGLNNYYWSNAFSLGKHFSLGVKSSLISGSINQNETIYDNALSSTILTEIQDYYSHFRLEYGGIYKTDLDKKSTVSIGVQYIPQTKLSSERTLTVSENSSSIISDKLIKTGQFSLPQTFGAGLALVKNKKVTVAADYTYESWDKLGIGGTGWKYTNSQRFAAGLESSKITKQYGRLAALSFVQFGGFYETGSLVVRNQQINEFGVTAGYGKHFLNGLSMHVSGEVGVRGTMVNNLIKENYFQLNFNFSYKDFLFSKGRKYN